MEARGELGDRPDALVEDGKLPPEFWEEAEVWYPPAARRSVHLKLEPEVFDFFKDGGKGHLTRMQNVLAAYVRAQKSRA
ncbi:BrnA antitoxin family protein [Pseudoroseicyclus sp. CXY001]|uniref:BrnA antitoxin family protein n=1 Tax=Pseudoroseicyclus sp. CXY001 TaxID=3242492 RepID=UPI0035714C53